MSILIKGVEMPKNCHECLIYRSYRCPILNTQIDCPRCSPPPDGCPLVPVPPHGDLIDRREAIIDANERAYDFWLSDDEVNATIQFLNEQTTIILAEEGKLMYDEPRKEKQNV